MLSAKNRELKALFVQDGGKILESLGKIFASLDKDHYDGELVNGVFRHVHSLKSEASFLGFTEITRSCEKLESLLASVRSKQTFAVGDDFAGLRNEFAALARAVREIMKDLRIELAGEPVSVPDSAGEENFIPNDFEAAVLKGALDRGERFYRIQAAVDGEEPMPYPRLYLLVNNLELHANVVRIVPSLGVLKEGKTFAVTVYITTRRNTETVRRILDVDGVKDLKIIELPGEGAAGGEAPLETEEAGRAATPRCPLYKRGPQKSVTIDRDSAETVSLLLNCLSAGAGEKYASILLGALRSIGREEVPFSPLLDKARRMTLELAERIGKKIRVEVRTDSDSFLPSAAADAVNEILTHLVRNVVDHGIDSPSDREKSGKPAEGRVIMEGVRGNGGILLRIADDGTGIREEEIRAAAKSLNMKLPADARLLDFLSHPGFSTRTGAAGISGRGVGLDIVRRIVEKTLNGRLELWTEPGKGSAFTVTFSEHNLGVTAFAARIGDRLLKIPKTLVDEIFPLHADNVVRNGDGGSYPRGSESHPIRLLGKQAEVFDGVGILVRVGSISFIVLADEASDESLYSPRDLLPSVAVLLKAAGRKS